MVPVANDSATSSTLTGAGPPSPRPPAPASLGRVTKTRSRGQHQDLQIEPQGPVLDVVVVPLRPVGERRLAAQTLHLRPARDPGPDAVAVGVAVDRPVE